MTASVNVKFTNVGRDKRNWSQSISIDNFWNNIAKAIKRSCAIMSQDIEFIEDDSGIAGVIVVGGFRTVGKFEITDPEKLEQEDTE